MGNIFSNYQAALEDTECTSCYNIGMLPCGLFDYVCPVCGKAGSFLYDDDADEEDDFEEEFDDFAEEEEDDEDFDDEEC